MLPELETLTDEQIKSLEELVDEYGTDMSLKLGLSDIAKSNDTPEGFAAFFEVMHGTPLHSEGVKWIENAYLAHSSSRGLAQECHRESGKTTVFSKFFLAFRLGHEPQKTWGIIRVNDDKANETAAGVAHMIEYDPNWKLIFPHVVPDHDRGWGAKGYYLKRTDIEKAEWDTISTGTSDDPTFVGYGWGAGGVIGSRFSGGAVVDDIHNEENVNSDRLRARIRVFVTDTLEYCLMQGAWEIWNFTPWTTTDVYAYIKSTGEYVHSVTPVMTPGVQGGDYWPSMPLNLDYPEYGNIPLSGRYWSRYWPEAWPWERIASKYRKSGAIGFARMMLLDLEATKGLNLKSEWLHRYPASDIDPSWPIYFGVDYATTADRMKNKDSDFFAVAILAAIPGGGLVLLDGYRGRISKGEALAKVVSMAGVYPTLQLVGVESIGEGRGFYNDLVMVDDALGRPLSLHEVKSHGKQKKGERFENWLAPRFQMARVWVSNVDTPFINAFMEEWLTYPNAAHDDTLDAVYIACLAGEGHMAVRGRRSRGVIDMTANPNPYQAICSARRSEIGHRK